MSSAESSSIFRPKAIATSWRRRDTARQFLPASLEILETPASPVGRAIGATLIASFVIAVVWSVLGHVDIIATAPGKVVPTGRTKTIQPLEAAIVAAIHVRDGDHVTAGQVLVQLDKTVAQAEHDHIFKDLIASKLDVARLVALREAFDQDVPPADFPVPAGTSETDIARTRSAMKAQASEELAKIASVRQQIEQKQAEEQSVRATIAKIDATLPLVQEEASVREKAMQIQFGNRIAYLDAQTKLVDQQNERIVQQRKIVELEAARAALERQVDQTKSGYEHQVLNDLSDAEKKAGEFEQDLIKAEEKVEQETLRSPIDGTVQQLAIHTLGGVVTPAQQLMVIVPTESRLEAEVMINNRDIGFVHVGQPAEIKIDTFNFTRYGLLRGEVESISQDAIVRDKPAERQGAPNSDGALSGSSEPEGQELLYSARVSLDRVQMQVDDRLVNLEPGMAVTVEVKTGTRRIIGYLMSPLMRYEHESLRER